MGVHGEGAVFAGNKLEELEGLGLGELAAVGSVEPVELSLLGSGGSLGDDCLEVLVVWNLAHRDAHALLEFENDLRERVPPSVERFHLSSAEFLETGADKNLVLVVRFLAFGSGG